MSTSTQSTTFNIEKAVLDDVKEVTSMEMTTPNLLYMPFDFKKFKDLENDGEETVYLPLEKPYGLIHAELDRE